MKWFKHDTDSNRDGKLEKVLMRYGAEGYALYWLCLELIAGKIDKQNINFELEHDSEILAYRLRLDSTKVEEMMRYMVSLGLFEIDTTTQRITCLKLATRIENSTVKSPYLLEIQRKLKSEEISDDPGLSENIPEDSGKLGLEKNRKEEKRKEKKPAEVYDQLRHCVDEGLFFDFLKHRTKAKAPNTERAMTLLATKILTLKDQGHDPNLLIETAIERGWKTVFPPDDRGQVARDDVAGGAI